MRKQKWQIAAAVLFVLLSLTAAYCVRVYHATHDNSLLKETAETGRRMTMEQKLSDFNALYQSLQAAVPMLDDVKNTCGVDFTEKYARYRGAVLQTQDDYAFYCVLSAMTAEMPSFHTAVLSPQVSSYLFLGCHNWPGIFGRGTLPALTAYWGDVVQQGLDARQDQEIAVFRYVDGGYVFDPDSGEETLACKEGDQLLSIDGVRMEDYIRGTLGLYAVQWDNENERAYRSGLVFTRTEGTPVKVCVRSADGSIRTAIWRRNLAAEGGYVLRSAMGTTNGNAFSGTTQVTVDEENDLCYLSVGSLMLDKLPDIQKATAVASQYGTLILDLRGNSGGLRQVASALHSGLFADSITQPMTCYVPECAENECIYDGSVTITRLGQYVLGEDMRFSDIEGAPFLDPEKTWKKGTTTITYAGGATKNPDRVYVLVDRSTGSAADSYVAALKDSGLATVIGTHTGGEGLGDSFNVATLPESGIGYMFMPSLSYNEDGTDNSIYGTLPDVEISQNIAGFYIQRKQQKEWTNYTLYANRLKWDTVLQQTLLQIAMESAEAASPEE